MNTFESLKHPAWECKYHVVFMSKYRKRVLSQQLRRELGTAFRELAPQQESEIIKGHLRADQVHRLISIPLKHSVSSLMGFMKGKSAIQWRGCAPGGGVTTWGSTSVAWVRGLDGRKE